MLPPSDFRGTFRTDMRARAAYAEAAGIYRILPAAIALPSDVEDLTRLIAWAGEQKMSLVPRGAGSGMGGGNVGDGVVVDLTRMRGPRLEIDPTERRAVTSSGVTLAELNDAAAPRGLRLPPDPSSGRWATVGGLVSTNAAGARSVRYGSVRRWIEGLTLITADGEAARLQRRASNDQSRAVTRFNRDVAPAIRESARLIARRFPTTRKNSSGYALDAYLSSGDILDLVVGAEGTLGVVTDVEWRLDPVPACRAGLRVELASLDHLGHAVSALSRCQPSALELLDRSFLELVGSAVGSEDAILLVELERDDSAALERALEAASAAARPWATSVRVASSASEYERLWALRHSASPLLAGLPETRRSLQVIEDACVPVDRMSDYIRAVRLAASKRDLPVVMFGHAGDGHVHVNLLPELARPGWEAAVTSLLDEVTDQVVRLGGTPSGEHGDGRLRSSILERVYGAEIMDLFRRVKQSFDPLGMLNPGVILPSGDPPISRLKVGASAAPLPADIQRALREIELSGGYSRCRLEVADGARS